MGRDLVKLQDCWKSNVMIQCLHVSASPWVNKFVEQMFEGGNFSFPPEICNNGVPTHNDLDPNNSPCDDPHHTRDNPHKVDSALQSATPSVLSPNPSPTLPPSSSTLEAGASPSHTRPFFSSTGLPTSNDDSNCVPSEFS